MAEEIRRHCGTCEHGYLGPGYEPCKSCGNDCSNWNAALPIVPVQDSKELKKYTYFIVYGYEKANNGPKGIGSCYIEREDQIRTTDDVEGISDDIRKEFGIESMTIINWKELEG